MTNTYHTSNIFHVDHSTFGGVIYPSDFETDYRRKNSQTGSAIASRIMSDLRFDRQCRQNVENRATRTIEMQTHETQTRRFYY